MTIAGPRKEGKDPEILDINLRACWLTEGKIKAILANQVKSTLGSSRTRLRGPGIRKACEEWGGY